MSTPREALLNISTVVVAVCTVFLTGFTVYRHMATRPVPDVRGRQLPVMVDSWEKLAEVGHRLGPSEAEVTVVVFSDFECPTCNTFDAALYPPAV